MAISFTKPVLITRRHVYILNHLSDCIADEMPFDLDPEPTKLPGETFSHARLDIIRSHHVHLHGKRSFLAREFSPSRL